MTPRSPSKTTTKLLTTTTIEYPISINFMDYSLLVGVDRQCRELVCGIIDYLRQYTWDKQLETWVKSSLVVPTNVLHTIISLKEDKKRFRKFMDTHFLTVPDHWCSQRSSNPCKLCGIKGSSWEGQEARRAEWFLSSARINPKFFLCS